MSAYTRGSASSKLWTGCNERLLVLFGWRGVPAVKPTEGGEAVVVLVTEVEDKEEEEEGEEEGEEEEEEEEEQEEEDGGEKGTARPFFPFLFFVALVDDIYGLFPGKFLFDSVRLIFLKKKIF